MEVAIIVPVYNVEEYLRNCIESLLKQTKKIYNIYLIDDGSTDTSGKICDEYANKYDCITVFHKMNGGLSDARNYGVLHTDEPIITFVDSDDTIREDYVEKLYNAINEKNIDISIANFIPVKEQILEEQIEKDSSFVIEDSKTFLKCALLGEKGSLSSCGKFFKRYLLENNLFPKGKLYEDMEVIYRIINSVPSVAYINQNLYFYLMRDNSIVHSRVTEKHKYGIASCIHMLKVEIDKEDNDLKKYIKCRIVKQACGHLPNLVKYNDYQMFLEISKMVKKYLKSTIFGFVAPIKLRILALAYYMPPKLGIRYAKIIFKSKEKIKKYN